MTKLIKEKINTIINTISSKKEMSYNVPLPNGQKIERSNSSRSDEFGNFHRMENL